MNGSRDPFLCALGDVSRGYGYIGAGNASVPGQIYKLRLGPGDTMPTPIVKIELNMGETPRFGAIDTANGYAYFVTNQTPGKVIKIALGDGDSEPFRVGELALNAGETASCCAIDTASGCLFVGTNGTPGSVIKIALGAGSNAPTRLGSVALNAGEDSLASVVIDAAGRHAYFGTNTVPGRIIKVSLGDGTPNPVRVAATTLTEDRPTSAAIDPVQGYLYFVTSTNPGFLIKIPIPAGMNAPVPVNSLNISAADGLGANFFGCIADPASGHIFTTYHVNQQGTFIQKIRLNSGNTIPTYLSTYGGDVPGPNTDAVSTDARGLILDPVGRYLYLGGFSDSNSSIGEITKLRTGVGDAPVARIPGGNDVGKRSYNLLHDNPIALEYSSIQNRLYSVTPGPGRARVMSYDPASGNAAPIFVKAAEFGLNNNGGTAAGINSVTKTAFVVSGDAKMLRASLRDDPLTIDINPNQFQVPLPNFASTVVLTDTGISPTYGYIGGNNGHIAKFTMSNHTPFATSVNLNGGAINCGVIDTANGYGYVGTSTGNVVKFALNGASDPTIVGTPVLVASGFSLTAAAIDASAGYAYFCGSTTAGNPGVVVKVLLGVGAAAPSVAGTATLASDESGLTSIVLDSRAENALVGTNSTPAKVVTVAKGAGGDAPTRVSAITLNAKEGNLRSAAIDIANGYAYFASSTVPGRITKVSTGFVGRMRASAITLQDNVSVTSMSFYSHNAVGKLRLALYDDASPRNLVWQSAELTNTVDDGLITVNISSGSPSTLTLPAGKYWLAWNTDTNNPVASYSPGAPGDGFLLSNTFGPFPSSLTGETATAERWTQFITFDRRPTFRVTGPANWTAGTSQNITLTAVDRLGVTQTDYTGTKQVVLTGALPSTNPVTAPTATATNQPFNQSISVTFTNGVATVPLLLYKAETATLSVTDPSLSAITELALTVTVAAASTPAAQSKFVLSGPATATAGSAIALTITAQDQYGNVRTASYTGSKNLTFTGAAVAPDATAPTVNGVAFGTSQSIVFTAGVATVSNVVLVKTQTAGLKVSDGTILEQSVLNVTVSAGAHADYAIQGNTTQTAGTAQTVTLLALDQFGNNINTLSGTLNVTFAGASDSINNVKPTVNGQNFGSPGVSLVFVGGAVSVPMILVRDENAVITATSGGGVTTPSPLTVNVAPAAAATLTLSKQFSTQLQNESQTYTVAAFDAFANPALNYTGTVAFTSSDALAVLPANLTLPTNTRSVTLRTVGNQAVNVTDTVNAALTSSTIVTVGPAEPNSIVATLGTPQTATVGTAFTTPLMATVLDSGGSPIAGTSVIFDAPDTGASGAFDGPVTVLTDGNGVATAPGFTANTAPGTYNVSATADERSVNFVLTNAVGAPVTITASAGSNQTATVGAAFGTALSATVRDLFNNPISGVNVTFAVPGTGSSGAFGGATTVATNSSGVATASTLTANTTPGTFMATATAGALQAVYTLTVVNDIPVAGTQNLSALEGNPLAVTLTGTDLTAGTLAFTLVSNPQNGSVSGTPPNVTYTPNAGFTGPDSFDFKVNDGVVDSVAASIFITVQPNNAKPTVTSISQTAGTLNQAAFALTVNGTNFVNGAVVTWNGQALATTFVSATELSAAVTAAQLASAGNIPVAVLNPVPQAATSNSVSYFLYSGTVGTWIVTNTNDAGQGSLRLALASARNGDSILFDPTVFDLVNSDAETLINVLSELPALDDGNVTLDASNRRVSVNGSGANSARGLVINSDNNTVQGLTLLGFARSGISVQPGAANNVIGGGRSVGGGPNGQGLRISGNGTYGVEILGAGATGNVVKGCWIGLDASGTGAQPNLAGVIVGDGATANTIGSTVADEENVVSGNSLEGITVAGSGTDDNVVIGNSIGASAPALGSRAAVSREGIPSRSAAGNGSAGLFLSKGTKGTKNGGTNAGEGNSVAFNGGNGIEVRSPNARRNSARGNRVTANSRGGIALFDGSNDGVKAPVVESLLKIPTRNVAAQTRAAASARVRGTTGGNGTVELFNDSGEQGAVIVGRAIAANGAFETEIDIDDLLNVTATFTDENGNTSPFGFFGRTTGNAGSPDDADGDGFSDSLETLAGTDPQNAAAAPVSAGALAVDASRISLNFVSPAKDQLGATVRVALPDGFTLPQSTVGLMFGGVTKSFTLDAKLRSPKAASTLKATASKEGAGALFKFALKNEDLKAGLAAAGLGNTTTAKTGEAKAVNVILSLKGATGSAYVYAGTVNLTYKATQGKTGKAANAK